MTRCDRSWCGGASRDRTDDLRVANATLSQLSYGPFRLTFRARKQQSCWTPLTHEIDMVGLGGVEPPTSPLSGVRSNQLSYRPGFPIEERPGSRASRAPTVFEQVTCEETRATRIRALIF